MNFTEFFIRRPVFTLVISLVLTIAGIIGYLHLPLRWIPNISPPIVSVYTEYAGASAGLVESQISTPIEASLAGVDGIETLSSNSREGVSFITLEFKQGHSLNAAVEDVRSAIQRINGTLPIDAKTPIINKADSTAMPIMYIAFSDSKRSPQDVSDYVKQFILPQLQTVEGVATVSTYGERQPALHIWLDPAKMTASNITVEDINNVLTQQNIEVPSGKIRSANRYYNVVTNETLKNVNEFNDLILRDTNNQTVRLKDVAEAKIDAEDSDSIFRVNGNSAVALAIVPQSNANPLDVAKQIKIELQKVKKTLPASMQTNIVFDQSDFIKSSIFHVYESLFESILLVLLVIFLFLASWRAAFIPIITIPVCLITTFGVMYISNASINTITLMAFVLAIGLVVDDAIVMLENIMRYREQGMQPFPAAIKGSREIVFPIIAMTITLAAVYAPIAFTSGILGSVFWEFAITLAGAVLVSGLVALTLSPMMSARLLGEANQRTRYGEKLFHFLDKLQAGYQRVLDYVLERRGRVILLVVIAAMIGFFVSRSLPTELSPLEDMNQVEAHISAPRNASFDYTDSYARTLEKIYDKVPEVEMHASEVGFWSPSKSTQYITLVPRNKRSQSVVDIAATLNDKVKNIAGVKISIVPSASPLSWFSDGSGASVVMKVMSSMDYKNLHDVMQRFVTAAQKYPGFTSVDSSLKWDGEQFEVNINREKADDMKVPMSNITNAISILMAGRMAGHYEFNGNLYNIIVQMNQAALSNPNIISELYVRNQNNSMVPLSDLASVTESTSPESLPHFDRLRADTLHATLAPGTTIAEAVNELQTLAAQILPDNAKYSFQGDAKTYLDSSGKMGITFLLALLFIYLVLAAQFESFVDPFVILLTVPFAIIGALVTLKMVGGSLNLYSGIALVTLIGLIAKHGILITEFANQQRRLGKYIEDAVITAAKLRLRPILMTTAAMVLGALPLALASGSGSETRQQIGWVIVGGLLFGTFFSLIVVPIAYTYLARFKKIETVPVEISQKDASPC